MPLAVTEAHLGCTRDEQMRWLAGGLGRRASACAARGVDVRAVTAWSLLGAYDWDSLVTRADGPLRAGRVRPAPGHAAADGAGATCCATWPRGARHDAPRARTPAGGAAPSACSTPRSPVQHPRRPPRWAAAARRQARGPTPRGMAYRRGSPGPVARRDLDPAAAAAPDALGGGIW